jgi:hypothetical protein
MNNYDMWLRLDNQNTDYSKEALIQYNRIFKYGLFYKKLYFYFHLMV